MNSQTSGSMPPVFILSCERAGSTLLRYIVDTHPDICSPAELHTGRLCASLIHTARLLGLGQVSQAVDKSDRTRLAFLEVRRVVSEWMDSYARRKGKRMWCEKSPRNLKYLDVLKNVFPDAKYICLHRHCMDVVQSCLEGSANGFVVDLAYYARNISDSYAHRSGNHISAFIDSWIDKAERLLRFEQENASNCFRIKYESLVENPGEVLRPMFEFLGVEWDERLPNQVFSIAHDQGPGDQKAAFSKRIHRDSVGRGSTISRSLIPRDMVDRMNSLLVELGYPIVGPDWGINTSANGIPSENRESAESPSDQVSESLIKDIFSTHFPRQLEKHRDRLPQIRGNYKFIVTGSGGGTWTINLKEGHNSINTENGEADCTFMVSATDLAQMVSGKLNAANATIEGRLRVAGDSRLALALGPLLLGA
jgi:protein-tyrosine sulfotransferase